MPSHDQGIHTCFLAAGSWCLTISWGLTGECESHPTPVRVTPAGWYPAHSTPPPEQHPRLWAMQDKSPRVRSL